jgi:hypothetical protein
MARKATLGDAFKFNAEDLDANRQGRMGAHQMRGVYFFGFTWIIMGVLFAIAMAVAVKAQHDRDTHQWYDLLFPLIFAIPICGVCFLLGFGRLRAVTRRSVVKLYTGVVRPDPDKSSYWFVGDKRFRMPGSGGSNFGSNPAPKLLKGEPTCNVYIVNSVEAVSVEIVG